MADKSTLEQMLEHLVNEDNEKAEELFHDYVVSKSREIYENLIQEEMDEEDEASEKDEDDKDEEVDEMFDEVSLEADDEDGDMPDLDMGDEKTDDLAGELDDEGDDDADKSEEELFQDLDDIVSELESKFAELKGEEDEGDMGDMDDMGDEEEMKDSFDDELATVREYVEKVAGGHGAETKGAAEGADNKKSTVDNMKNDMGGTTANIAKGGEDSGKNDGGLADITPKEENANNVNTAGSKNATNMNSTKGHGAEKKGAGETADNKQSLFRGQR